MSNVDGVLTVSSGATSYSGRVGDVYAELLANATTARVDTISLESVRCEMDGGGLGAEVANRARKSMKGRGTAPAVPRHCLYHASTRTSILLTCGSPVPARKDVGKRLNALGGGSLA